MAAGDTGAPAPYSFVGRPVRVRPVGDGRDTRGVLEDATQLGIEVLSEGRRHFMPWAGVSRLTLVEEDAGR